MQDNTPNNLPHFRISAAVVKQLGEELITDEVTAFMELVKNSYDADSTKVTLDINTIEDYSAAFLTDPSAIRASVIKSQEDHPTDKKDSNSTDEIGSGYISIKDNGCGMSKDDIIDKWMTISLSEKRGAAKNGIKTDKGRTYLGEKGVGRLSTQRLGSIIDLITGRAGDDFYSHLYFDWDSFNENITLDEVKPVLKQISKSRNESGTEIIIRHLKSKEVWEGESYFKIIGQLSQLISPRPNAPGGFKVNIKKNNSVQDLLDINKSIDQSFVSSFTFTIDENKIVLRGLVTLKKLYGSTKANHGNFERFVAPDNGKDFFSFLTDKQRNKRESLANIEYLGKDGNLFSWTFTVNILDIPELVYVEKRDNDDNIIFDEQGLLIYELAHPGPFTAKINDYSFVKDFGQVLDSSAHLKTIIQNQTGIRIYRDGFGIKPYGINSQDWLKLGAGNTSGSSFYGLKPFNVIGFIEITAKDNYYLREKTDREGFIESPHSINFFKIMEFCVKQINLTLEKTRRSLNEYIKFTSTENTGIDPIQETFNSLTSTAKNSRELEKRMQAVNFRLANARSQIKSLDFDDKLTNNTKEKFNEQLGLLNALLSDSNLLVDEISSILNETKKLDSFVNVLKPQIESLENQLSEFTDLASLGLTAESLSHELSNIADKLYEDTNKIIRNYAKRIPPELIKVNIYLESVKSSVTSFRKQLSHLDPALKYVRESKETFSLLAFFKELKEYYEEKFDDSIEIILNDNNKGTKAKANKGKLIQIVDNIVLNSVYWLKEKTKQEKKFGPQIYIDIDPPYIKIWDNGVGIPQAIEDTLFQPFVTLKPKGIGRGLGLFIVQQLLDSVGCSVTLLPDRNSNGNKYIFQLYINSIIAY